MRHIFTILLATLALASCTLEMSDNGDLDGFWHLTSVDTLATGGNADYSERKVFWMFQSKLYNMKEFVTSETVVGHFRIEGDSLFMEDVFKSDRMNGDPAITDVSQLKMFGANAINEHYQIVSLSSGKMTLRSKMLQLSFRKQ